MIRDALSGALYPRNSASAALSLTTGLCEVRATVYGIVALSRFGQKRPDLEAWQ